MRVSTYFVVGIMIASSTVVFAADVQSRPGEKTEDRAVARQCLKDLQAFDEKLAETGFGFLPPGGYGSTARSGSEHDLCLAAHRRGAGRVHQDPGGASRGHDSAAPRVREPAAWQPEPIPPTSFKRFSDQV